MTGNVNTWVPKILLHIQAMSTVKISWHGMFDGGPLVSKVGALFPRHQDQNNHRETILIIALFGLCLMHISS